MECRVLALLFPTPTRVVVAAIKSCFSDRLALPCTPQIKRCTRLDKEIAVTGAVTCDEPI
jgi:hypothetical protein